MVKRWLQVAALVLVAAASTVLLLVPTYESATTSSNGTETVTTQSMLEVNGPWLLVVLAAPIVLAVLPVFARGRTWVVLSIVSATLLWVGVILGSLTIGIFFVPGAILALIAACLPVRSNRAAAAPA
ncbi:hypothetical protein [Microbacterium deminutum]